MYLSTPCKSGKYIRIGLFYSLLNQFFSIAAELYLNLNPLHVINLLGITARLFLCFEMTAGELKEETGCQQDYHCVPFR